MSASATQTRARHVLLQRSFESLNQIGPLPAESTISLRRAAKVAVSRSALVYRAVEPKVRADAARGQVHHPHYCRFNLCWINIACTESICIDRQGLGDANRIGELNGATLGQTGRNHVFSQIPRRIGG